MTKRVLVSLLGLWLVSSASFAQTDDQGISPALRGALDRAGDNKAELLKAQARLQGDQLESLRFLVTYMPVRDLKSLDADFLVTNVTLAHQVMQEVPWGPDVQTLCETLLERGDPEFMFSARITLDLDKTSP